MSTASKYPRIVQYVTETVWAIRPRELGVIWEMVKFRAAGGRLDQDDIDQRIGGARKPDTQSQGAVAVIPLWGILVPHAGMMVDQSTAGTGLDQWLQTFREAVADPNVASILLDVNSPGGSVSGVTEAAAEIRAARAKKPVAAVANSLAASAGYALAAQADTLIVPPSGQVGSIGTYMIHEDISAQLEAEGVKVTIVESPADGFKTEGSPFKPLSDEARAHMQQMADYYQGLFEDDVARGRRVDSSTVREQFGRGRVYTARAALAAGMVDGIGTIDQTLQRMLSGKPPVAGKQEIAAPAPLAVAAASFVAVPSQTGFVYDLPAPVGNDVTLTIRNSSTLLKISGDGTGVALPVVEEYDIAPRTAEPVLPAQIPAATAATTTAATGRTNEGGTMDTVATDGRPPTLEELAAQRTQASTEMREIVANAPGRELTDDEQGRFDSLEQAIAQIDRTTENIEKRNATLARIAGNPAQVVPGTSIEQFHTNAGRRGPKDIFDLAAYRSHARSVEDLAPLWKEGAKRANEITSYRTMEQDRTRQFVEALIDQDESSRTHDSFANRVLVTANPNYDAAFGRWVMGRERGQDAEIMRQAVTNTGLGGETPVPITIDPTVLYTGDGARSPLRELAQVVSITGLTWRGIGSDGVSMAYAPETAAVTPQTPSFDAPDVSVVRANGEIQFSVDVEMDWPTLRSELQRMFSQAKFRLEADKFLNGTGTNEPTGLIWALDDDGSSVFDTADANTLTLDDVVDVSDDLPSSFDFAANWLAHKAFYSNVARLAANEGRIDVWVPLSGGFNQQSGNTGHTLLNSGAYTASEISKLFDTGGEEVAVIGDFGQGFVIVDRIGLNVELDPHPRDGDGKWAGNRALLCYFRNNTAVRTPNAFRLLRIKHT